jgi:hypothetical protein
MVVLSVFSLLFCQPIFAGSGRGESASGFLTSRTPEAPLLYSPTNESFNIKDTITLIWHSQIHTSAYILEVSSVIDFHNLFTRETCSDTTFTLNGFEKSNSYYWRVRAYNVAGNGDFSNVWSFTTSSASAVDMKNNLIPKRYALLPAYPNPFNPMTSITYHLPEEAPVSIVIYNSLGQIVRELVSYRYPAGEYIVTWDGRDSRGILVTSGVYLCHFKTGGYKFTQKIMLIR